MESWRRHGGKDDGDKPVGEYSCTQFQGRHGQEVFGDVWKDKLMSTSTAELLVRRQ